MAYQPTQADFPPPKAIAPMPTQGTYQPTQADFSPQVMQAMQQQAHQNFMNQNFSTPLQDIRQLPQNIDNAFGGAVHGVLNTAGNIPGLGFLKHAPIPPAAQPNSGLYQAGNMVGSGATALGAGAGITAAFPEIAGAAALGYGAGGALTSPSGSRMMGAAIGAAAPYLPGVASKAWNGIKSLPELIQNSTGKALSSQADAVANDLTNSASRVDQTRNALANNMTQSMLGSDASGQPVQLSNLNQQVGQDVRGVYNQNAKASQSQFNDIRASAQAAGYNGQGQLADQLKTAVSGVDSGNNYLGGVTAGKSINALPYADELQAMIDPKSAVPESLKPTIQSFVNSPTYDNAHTLQSELSKTAADINAGVGSTAPDRNLAAALTATKNNVLQSIQDTFSANGDDDLANDFANARQNYKQTVVPFRQNGTIWNAIQNNKVPNLANAMKDSADSTIAVRNMLPQEAQSRLLAAQLPSSAMTQDASGMINTNPNALESALGKSRQLSSFITPDLRQSWANLSDLNEFSRQIKPYSSLPTEAVNGKLTAPQVQQVSQGVNALRQNLANSSLNGNSNALAFLPRDLEKSANALSSNLSKSAMLKKVGLATGAISALGGIHHFL